MFHQAFARLSVTQSMGRPGSALDRRGFDSAPLGVVGVNSTSELAALAFDELGVAGGGASNRGDVLVVGLVGGEQAGAAPGIEGGDTRRRGVQRSRGG